MIPTNGESSLAFACDTGSLSNQVERAAQVALGILNIHLTWPSGEPLTYRIELHCGPVVSGVIGTQRLQCDVWGDTVNVASRMESTGEQGKIQVSSEFYEQLSSQAGSLVSGIRSPKFTERGEVNVKGKGAMTTYWLELAR